ncbi:MAG TPA: aldo/keto reductase [Bryobacteraceae bacterium]|nr:aldo/keto reductase [Bryobacteraceae bacterium]
MERRDFLRSAAIAGGIAGRGAAAKGPLPRRRYKDNVELSIIGFGGIVVVGQEQKDADREVAQSVERGVNYFDVAPTYGRGEAETKLGPALEPHRKGVFLACKTTERTAEGARKELEQSLQRLRTDHFDLYQFHAVTTTKDVETILGPGGAAETFLKAREQGKVKYLGASAHSIEAAIAMMDRFPLDSILFPVNYVCYAQSNFGPQVVEHAKKKGIARLALKAMARNRLERGAERKYPKAWYEPFDDREQAAKALRFTLSEDITAAVPPGDERLYRLALDLAMEFKPLSARERRELLASSAGIKPLFPVG